MSGFVEQYLVNIAKIIDNPPSAVVGVSAQNLYNDTNKLVDKEITAEEYNANGYLEVSESDSDEVAQAKRSLNYIKDRIFKDATGYFETAKYYTISREVIMGKEELVKLYGANKKFYAQNGIKTKEEVETDITVPHALIYFGDSTIVAVDEDITAPNWISL
jgi:hypothetical protein